MKKLISILSIGLVLGGAVSCSKQKQTSEKDETSTSEQVKETGAAASPESEGQSGARKMGASAPKQLFSGINNEGADFGKMPGKDGSDWKYPTAQETDYWSSKNITTQRIGFRWERLQPALNGKFDDGYNNQLKNFVKYSTDKGINVLLNPQNFMRYNGSTVGSPNVPVSAFADFWSKLSAQFKDNPRVLFGLNNEPNGMSSATLITAENAAIAAIRQTGAKNIITVPGNGWTGVASFNQTWVDSDNKISNASLFNQIKDSGNNWMIELHHYPDSDAGGGFDNNTCTRNPTTELRAVVTWLRANNKKLIIGEYGAVNNENCRKLTAEYLQFISDNADVVKGMLVWAAGPIWGTNPVYKLSVEPTNLGKSNQADEPRVAWYQDFWKTSLNPISTDNTKPAPTTSSSPIVDAGVDSGVKDAGTSQDAGSTPYGITLTFSPRTPWSTGTCVNATLTNVTKASLAWHGAVINLNGASFRDYWNVRTNNKWGDKGEITLRPAQPQWIASGKTFVFGFCLDSKTPKVLPTVISVD